jgi:hypothetical protein
VALRGGQGAPFVEPQDLLETGELPSGVGEVLRVGVGEVRVDPLDLDVGGSGGGLQQAFGVVMVHADALHAGVDLEVHLRPLPARGRRRLDVMQAGEGRHGEREAVVEEERDLAGPGPAHDEDGVLDPQLPERDPLLDEGDPEGVGLRSEATRDRLEPVAVGVGLEDRHDPGRCDGVAFTAARFVRSRPGSRPRTSAGRASSGSSGASGPKRYGRRFALSVPGTAALPGALERVAVDLHFAVVYRALVLHLHRKTPPSSFSSVTVRFTPSISTSA